jgi:hypothetical protein
MSAPNATMAAERNSALAWNRKNIMPPSIGSRSAREGATAVNRSMVPRSASAWVTSSLWQRPRRCRSAA